MDTIFKNYFYFLGNSHFQEFLPIGMKYFSAFVSEFPWISKWIILIDSNYSGEDYLRLM